MQIEGPKKGKEPTKKTYLKDAFGEGGLLGELLEVLGIRIVIGGKVGFEHAQLLVFKRCSEPFRLLLLRVLLLRMPGNAQN